jgi:hypothetical protein
MGKRTNEMRSRHSINSEVNMEPMILTKEDLMEIYCFEGLLPISREIISKLTRNGWDISLFESLELLIPKCEHGKIVAYYSIRRNSIIWPEEWDGKEVTCEYTFDGLIHSYDLEMMAGLL